MTLKYFDYQTKAIHQISNKRFVILADEPGLGKTIQAIGVINKLKLKKILIICPSILRINWQNEINKWSDEKLSVQIIRKGTDILRDVNIYITSYGLITNLKLFKQLYCKKFQLLICDEGHYIKNYKSKRTQAITGGKNFYKGLHSRATQFLNITGTPIVNRPFDLWPIINKVCPEHFKPYTSFNNFTERYCNGYYCSFTGRYNYSGQSNIEEFKHRLAPIIIRRLKKDVLKELPDKQYQILDIEPTSAAKRLLKQEAKILSDLDYVNDFKKLQFSEIAKIRAGLAQEKIPTLIELVKNYIESGKNKIVIFSHHTQTFTTMLQELKVYNPLSIQGFHNSESREKSIRDFQNSAEHKIICCSIQAAGIGITLTASSLVIFLELPWTSADLQQSVDRCHRIGQKKSVLVQLLTLSNSLDSKILNTILKKEKLINNLIN